MKKVKIEDYAHIQDVKFQYIYLRTDLYYEQLETSNYFDTIEQAILDARKGDKYIIGMYELGLTK